MSQRKSTFERHRNAYNYFIYLWENKRLRYDDCLEKAAKKHFYSIVTMQDIIRKMKNNNQKEIVQNEQKKLF